MPESPHSAQEHFHGYVYFDDPDWWRGFTVTEKCARAIEEFRAAVSALEPWNGKEEIAYEAKMDRLWEQSRRAVELMQWHARKDIAVMVELLRLHEECVDRTEPASYRAGFIRNNLDTTAASFRAVLSTMHGVEC
jgi:hypothetical protein